MTDGLKNKYRKAVIDILSTNERVERVVLFGSRAMETFTVTSDVDIALFGDKLTLSDQAEFVEAIDELSMPQQVDILLYRSIKSEKLLAHIKRHGVEWWRRSWVVGSKSQSNSVQGDLYHPQFRQDWDSHILYDLANWLNGMAFRNIQFSPSGKPIVKIAELKNGISGQTKFTEDEYDSVYLVADGDMLFSWSGQPETSIDVFRWRGPTGWLNQHIFKIHPKNECRKSYFFYLMKYLNPTFVRIARNKQTTGLGHVTKKDLRAITVRIPSAEGDQRAIAHILGSIDDKIELNRQMNRTLEKMAQAIFKSWFIDFDPVHAKAEGRDTGLPKEIADLFPDSFKDSELGEIPKGWEVGDLQDLLVLQRGFDLPKKKRSPGKYPLVAASGQDGYHNEYKVNGPGVTTGRSGKLGVVTFVHSDFWPLNTTLWIKTYKRSNPYHAYFLLRTLKLEIYNAGSAVPTLNRNHIHNLRLPMPSEGVLKCFALYSQVFFSAINQNIEQVNCLSSLGDTLLPKLISGELSIPNVEKILEGVE